MALNENPTLEEILNEIERLNNLIVDRGGERIITPTTSNQILAKGNYKGDITVLGDANLIPSNILSGKTIFGVRGTSKSITMSSGYNYVLYEKESITIPNRTDYHLLTTIHNNIGSASSIKIEFTTDTFSQYYYMGYRLYHKRGSTTIAEIDPGYQADYDDIRITKTFSDFREGDYIEVHGSSGNSNAYLRYFKAYIGIKIS